MTEKKKAGLWERTKDVATTYTGTFIVIMILNQLLFFGFCLNPICIIAAMPHVLLITVFVGSIINKIGGWGERGLAKKTLNTVGKKLDDIGETIGSASEEILESTIKPNTKTKVMKSPRRSKRVSPSSKRKQAHTQKESETGRHKTDS